MFQLANNSIKRIAPLDSHSMQGAGIVAGYQEFITHTTLGVSKTAFVNLNFTQQALLGSLLALFVFRLFVNPFSTIVLTLAILSTVYFFDVVFNLYLMVKSLNATPDIKFTDQEILNLDESDLPIYTILCPLYKEAAVINKFVSSLDRLNWPKEKLDVIVLLEEDDPDTYNALAGRTLPAYIRTVIVPASLPRTKPKACNYGLSLAKGEYLVIFDAEDEPEPDQLKKAYLGFSKVSDKVICLQAKLSYYNPDQNLLTRFFTAEYSLWFDVILPGLQLMETIIPLGGTSNHFKTKALLALEGWDAFNVTEDADLGVRLFKEGFKTAIIDSTTYEEANSKLGNWVRQRSRWIKGYIQTYFVYMRDPVTFFRKNGMHAWIFQLLMGGRIAFCFINPFLWVMTISYFAANSFSGPLIEALYPSHIFYLALVSLLFGNFIALYFYMIGCAKRSQWHLVKYLIFVPFYWLLISFASFIALWQFFKRPHYWEKTVHGLYSNRTLLSELAWRTT